MKAVLQVCQGKWGAFHPSESVVICLNSVFELLFYSMPLRPLPKGSSLSMTHWLGLLRATLPSLPTEAGCVMHPFVHLFHACHRVQKAKDKPSDANETLTSIMTISQCRGRVCMLHCALGLARQKSEGGMEEWRGILCTVVAYRPS